MGYVFKKIEELELPIEVIEPGGQEKETIVLRWQNIGVSLAVELMDEMNKINKNYSRPFFVRKPGSEEFEPVQAYFFDPETKLYIPANHELSAERYKALNVFYKEKICTYLTGWDMEESLGVPLPLDEEQIHRALETSHTAVAFKASFVSFVMSIVSGKSLLERNENIKNLSKSGSTGMRPHPLSGH